LQMAKGTIPTVITGPIQQEITKLVNARAAQLSAGVRESIPTVLSRLYREDGLSSLFPGMDKFVRPNIAMDYEVVDAISPSTPGLDDKFLKAYYRKIILPAKDQQNGLRENRTILRLHIYDEESVQSPAEASLLSTMTQGLTGRMIVGKGGASKLFKTTQNMSFNEAKQYVKRSYPTIIYGAAGSTIKSLSVSSNTSGELSNVLMVESYGNLRNGQVAGHNYNNNFESVIMFPQTVDISMMGMPMIGIGNTFFIDFGTDTSLDNIYTVKNVTHSISAGDFSTTLQVVPSNMGAIESFSENLSKSLEGFIQ
jgi:hypothetical protein